MKSTMLRVMFGNWITSVLGIVAGAYTYVAQQGLTLPMTKEQLKAFIGSLLIAAIGIGAKDATTGSKQGQS